MPVVLNAPICVVDRPPTWVVLRASTSVAVSAPIAAVPSAPTCVELRTPNWVVVSAAASVAVYAMARQIHRPLQHRARDDSDDARIG